jgi:cytidylate kinase
MNPSDPERTEDPRELPEPWHGFRGESPTGPPSEFPIAPSIAISREAGARGTAIARRIGEKSGWLVCDHEMLGYTAQDPLALPSILADAPPGVSAWIDAEIDRLATSGIVRFDADYEPIARLILALGARGEIVFVGRGAGFLLPRSSTLHVRLTAPLEDRVAYLGQLLRLPLDEAKKEVAARDAQRQEFLQRRFRYSLSDLPFDMTLNSVTLGSELCVELILAGLVGKSNARFQGSLE